MKKKKCKIKIKNMYLYSIYFKIYPGSIIQTIQKCKYYRVLLNRTEVVSTLVQRYSRGGTGGLIEQGGEIQGH